MKKSKEDTEFIPIINLYEEDTCAAMKKYTSEMVEDMQKFIGMEPGKCPIAKGNYTVTDYPLDFGKVGIQTIPDGILRSEQVITDKKTGKVLLCAITEVENIPEE